MLIYKHRTDLRNWTHSVKRKGQTIAFVPTMGALHEGHLSLVRLAEENADHAVVSIFVNPTQFNEAKDLEDYPRTLEKDLYALSSFDRLVLLVPSYDAVYPNGPEATQKVDLGRLGEVYEGAKRPGHFDGVVQVLDAFLTLVEPNVIVMGEKDWQQVAVTQMLAKTHHPQVTVLSGSTKREDSGLAMSSRNLNLSEAARIEASAIYEGLIQLKAEILDGKDVDKSVETTREQLMKHGSFDLEYWDVVDEDTLELASSSTDSNKLRCVVAAWLDGVRLIDNMAMY